MNSNQIFRNRRVVITGLGVVSPVGNDIPTTWKALVEGQSGVDYITCFDTKGFDTKIAAEVKDFDASQYISRKQTQRMDRFTQFAVAASLQAMESARLKIDTNTAAECGVIIGNSVCGLLAISEQFKVLTEQGPARVSPILAPIMSGDAASVQVSLITGARGVNYAPSSACSSGSDAIGQAYNLIRMGHAKVAITGGTEAPIVPIVIATFGNIKALSTRNSNPQSACRPFDVDRDGFVMGEGAAIMILEEASHALERGATIIAELVGYGITSDAFHITQPAPDGNNAARAITMALDQAGISPDEVGYINAHGTATLLNDRMETNAIKKVFGERAKQIPVSASKSMIGHLLGGSGGIEALITVLALQHNVLPPTINLTHPDPECDLDYVPNRSRQAEITIAMSNSFGFGGHNSVLVFRKFQS